MSDTQVAGRKTLLGLFLKALSMGVLVCSVCFQIDFAHGSQRTGDLFIGIGYAQDSAQSIRDGTTVQAGGSPFLELFGTMADFSPFGIGIELSGRTFAADVTEATATKFTYSLVQLIFNAQLNVVDSKSFQTVLSIGGGGAWPVGRTCNQTCPFDDSIPPVSPTVNATARFEFDESYGIKVFGSHIPNAVWPAVIGPVTTIGATLFWNLTYEM